MDGDPKYSVFPEDKIRRNWGVTKKDPSPHPGYVTMT